MPSLRELTGLSDKVLQRSLRLEPTQRYAPNDPDNLVFVCPSVLIDDSELRIEPDRGMVEMGAKEVLSRVTKKIVDSEENSYLFEVPEITSTHLGYGKQSGNKEGKIAITKDEARYWRKMLDYKRFHQSQTGSQTEPMEVEDVLTPEYISAHLSGLKTDVPEGSHLLFFSILLIYLDKKTSGGSLGSAVGPNKISDFLIFWSLPFLLNFSHGKVQDIMSHRRNTRKFGDQSWVETVKMSAEEIIQDACKEVEDHGEDLLEVFRAILGDQPLKEKYSLLADDTGKPIIFVPLKYQVTDMSTKIEDLTTKIKWKELDVKLVEQFLMKFVPDKVIQDEMFSALSHIGEKQGIDYGIIFPDQDTYDQFIISIRDRKQDYVTEPQSMRSKDIEAKWAVISSKKTKIKVCFSLIQGTDVTRIGALFRAIGAPYANHFTITILKGYLCSQKDQRNLGNLHPVDTAAKYVKEKGVMRKAPQRDLEFHNQGKFIESAFPLTYAKWREEVQELDIIKEKNLKPNYVFADPVHVGYFDANIPKRDKELPFRQAALAPKPQEVCNCGCRVVNFDGCAIKFIADKAKGKGHTLIMALSDCCDKSKGWFSQNPRRMSTIIESFVRAVVVAGLPSVYEVETDVEDPETRSEDENEETHEDERMECSGFSGHSSASSFGRDPSRMPAVKELDRLSKKITGCWQSLGRQLGLEEYEIDMIVNDNVNAASPDKKAYMMLQAWHDKGSTSTYRQLAEALNKAGKIRLAEEFC